MRIFGGFPAYLIFLLVLTAGNGSLGLANEKDEKPGEKSSEKVGLPLKPTRTIEFSTDEGTWLSLDVSRDGQNLVFELVGDLYTLPIGGGSATRITEGMAFDSQPRFSPDGKWLAFLSDRDGAENLWIARADGSEPRRLTKEKETSFTSPAWHPDSQYVLVSKSSGRAQEAWMFHIDGGSGLELEPTKPESGPGPSEPAGGRLAGICVSPDGRYIYYASRGGGSVYNQMEFEWQIVRQDLQTGHVDPITQAQGGAFRPALSPDGKLLAYGTRYEAETGLRIRNLDTGEDNWLKYPIQRDDMESRGSRDLLPGFAFLPSGEAIVISYGGKIQRVSVPGGASQEIPFDARVSLELGPLLNFQRRVDEGPVRARLIMDPVQSPDGQKIAFSAMTHLYVMDLSTRNAVRLTSGEQREFKPTWSPDGEWIAYVSWDYEGKGHIWRVRSDGAAPPQQLSDIPAFYSDPAYSPDGTRIVSLRGSAWMRTQSPSEFGGLRIPLDLVWLSAEGGPVQLIVPARGLSTPHFSNRPERVYFFSREGLVSMRYDGSDRQSHLMLEGKQRPGARRPTPADDAMISPDGKWALAQLANQLYVVAVPPLGTGPKVKLLSPSVPAKRLTDIGADSFHWTDDGSTITWSIGSTFFRRSLESVSFQKKESEEEEKDEGTDTEQSKTPLEVSEGVESFEVVLEYPRPKPSGVLLLKGATLITMQGDEILERGDLLIRDNRIEAVGRSLQAPPGAETIDVGGKFIVPGFIDAHAHYEMRTGGVLELHNWSFLANLAYGVTSGLDVQTSTNDYLAYLDLVHAGMMLGPRAYSTGPGVFSNNDFQSAEAARFVLEKYKKYYQNDNLKSYVVGNRKQRQWVTQAAHELQLTVTTEGALDLKLDMTHAVDGFGGNEHSLPIVPLYKDVVELYAQSGIGYTPTLLVLYGGPWAENYFFQTTEVHDDEKLNRYVPHNEIDRMSKRRPWFRDDEHSFPRIAAQAAKIQRAGGKIGVGGHGQVQGLGFHWEMWALASGGMSPMEVLKAATIDGAHIIGLSTDLGSLTQGKLADVVVLDRNPLEDIRNTNSVHLVVKNGEVYDADTLQQVWPKRSEVPEFWWWNAAPEQDQR